MEMLSKLFVLVLLVGCAATPYTEEEVERDAALANQLLVQWEACLVDIKCAVQCDGTHTAKVNVMAQRNYIRRLDTMEKQARWYRTMHWTCEFVHSGS